MFKFLNLSPEVFGLDINDRSIKIVKLKKTRRGFSLRSYNELPLPEGIVKEGVIQNQHALAKSLRFACGTVKGEPLKTAHVAMSLPEEKSFSQIIRLPHMTAQELAKAIPFEAENYIPMPLDKMYLDFWIVNEPSNKSQTLVLVQAMPKLVVDAYLACAQEAGLVPCVMETESHAMARAIIRPHELIQPALYVDLGRDSATLAVHNGWCVHFTSVIPVSGQMLTLAIAEHLHTNHSHAEDMKKRYGLAKENQKNRNLRQASKQYVSELVAHIKKYMDFYRTHTASEYVWSQKPIDTIILSGGGANLKGLGEILSEQLHISVALADASQALLSSRSTGVGSISPQKSRSFATAVGLAMRAALQNFYD